MSEHNDARARKQTRERRRKQLCKHAHLLRLCAVSRARTLRTARKAGVVVPADDRGRARLAGRVDEGGFPPHPGEPRVVDVVRHAGWARVGDKRRVRERGDVWRNRKKSSREKRMSTVREEREKKNDNAPSSIDVSGPSSTTKPMARFFCAAPAPSASYWNVACITSCGVLAESSAQKLRFPSQWYTRLFPTSVESGGRKSATPYLAKELEPSAAIW